MISARRPSAALATRVALVLGGSALLAVSAQIAVPIGPVPITLQTLALALLVLAIGRTLAIAATLAYLVEGAAGLPVFSLWGSGVAKLIGPTAGFLWTFPIAAYLTGTFLESGLERTYPGRLLAIFAGTAIVFGGGAWWLWAGFHLPAAKAIAVGVTPFLFGDVLKCALAAALPPQRHRLG